MEDVLPVAATGLLAVPCVPVRLTTVAAVVFVVVDAVVDANFDADVDAAEPLWLPVRVAKAVCARARSPACKASPTALNASARLDFENGSELAKGPSSPSSARLL